METIELKTLSGYRLMLFRHEIKQVTEHSLVSKAPADEPGKEIVSVRPYCEVLTAWNQIHSVDESYDSVKAKVFGGE